MSEFVLAISGRLRAQLARCSSVVELGNGPYGWISGLDQSRRIAVDLFPPYVANVRATNPEIEAVLADVRDWIRAQPSDSLDAVLLMNILEHMEAPDGHDLIRHSLRVARRRVIVYVPNGWQPQAPEQENPEFGLNPLQAHVSGWTEDDLTPYGFSIERIPVPSVPAGALLGTWAK